MKYFSLLMLIVIGVVATMMAAAPRAPAQSDEGEAAGFLQVSGRIVFLRVHDVGTGYGPPTDFLDGEVVVALDTQPGKAFGFQLRNDPNALVHEGMLDMLRDAYAGNWSITLEYDSAPGRTTFTMFRLVVTR